MQTAVSFEDFNRVARIAAKPVYYNRSMKEYQADIELNNVRGFGHDKTSREIAVDEAVKNAYERYTAMIARENNREAAEPLRVATERLVKRELAAIGWTLDEFRWHSHDFKDFFVRTLDKDCGDLWRRSHSFTLETGPDVQPVTVQLAYQVDRLRLVKQDNIVHEKGRQLAEKRRQWLAGLPQVQPAQAKIGDVLISSRGEFFQVESISKTGLKIVVSRPYGTYGPLPLERLDKAEREERYMVTTYERLVYQMETGTRLRAVMDRIEQRKRWYK